jgi:hypothetical protein
MRVDTDVESLLQADMQDCIPGSNSRPEALQSILLQQSNARFAPSPELIAMCMHADLAFNTLTVNALCTRSIVYSAAHIRVHVDL